VKKQVAHLFRRILVLEGTLLKEMNIKPKYSGLLILALLLVASPASAVKREMRISPPPMMMMEQLRPGVKNPPAADGRTLVVTWRRHPTEVDTYLVQRREYDGGMWVIVGEAGGNDTSFVDSYNAESETPLQSGVKYSYRLVLKSDGWQTFSQPSKSVAARADWFDFERANVFAVIAVFFGSVLVFIERAKQGKSLFIRRIAGMLAMDEALGRATEMGRPALYIPGIMDVDNIQTIASMVILTEVARKTAQLDVKLIVPLNRAFVVPLAEESVKEGYLRSGRPDAYNPDDIRYLSDEQFAFTAGVAGIMNREKTAAHFFLGAFFAESLIVSEVGYATGAIQIAGTANIHQLPFFVVACDYTLIGEEFYAASAYISKDPQLVGTLKGSDLMKVLLMAAVFVGSFLTWFGVIVLNHFFMV